jgi:alcohol dehydrogenase (quinone), cytochrome c subunit
MKKWFAIAAAALLLLGIAVVLLALRPVHSPFEDPAYSASIASVSPAEAEYVVRLADCIACHSVPEGKPFAGGLRMGSPLGEIFATNITPDKDTGIGRYTLAEFDNAVRRGIRRDGVRLLPAMPYPSYAKMTDQDVKALYEYFMGITPVAQSNEPNELKWFGERRWPLAFWNLFFFDDEPYRSNDEFDAAWNRGAYIVQGPGHCGSCHTPRGVAFQEKALDESTTTFLSGALLDGWYASSLRGERRTGLARWTDVDIVEFLKTGRNQHATVYGSMMDAFNNSTQFMTDADLAAVARYLKSLEPRTKEEDYVYDDASGTQLAAGDLAAPGAGIYMSQCQYCHGLDGRGFVPHLPPLAGNPTLMDGNSSSVVNITLNGAGRIVAGGVPDSYRMPPFRLLLTDEQVADVSTFVRAAWGNGASAVAVESVRELRRSTDSASDHVTVLRMR